MINDQRLHAARVEQFGWAKLTDSARLVETNGAARCRLQPKLPGKTAARAVLGLSHSSYWAMNQSGKVEGKWASNME
ncbi:hypothetical protein ACP70R_004234 [Stipagrostis hirtigluma subsp. patula]